MADPPLAATRLLSTSEQVRLLKNQIAFLEEDIAEKEWCVRLLIDDNAETDFLLGVNERARTGAAVEAYRSNVRRIERLRAEIETARADLQTYRRVLAERYGEAAP